MLRFINLRFLGGLAMLMVLYVFQPALATDSVFEGFVKEMPDIQPVTQKMFAERTEYYEETPLGDEAMAYGIRLPKDWKKAVLIEDSNKFSIDSKVFKQVARYNSPLSQHGLISYVTIDVIELDYKMTAEQWFMQYLIKNGYVVQGYTKHSDNKVEALYVYVERGNSFTVRSLAILNGDKILMVRYVLPMEMWADERPLQVSVINSFEILKEKVSQIEAYRKYQFLDIVEVSYPETWSLRAPAIRSVDRIQAEILKYEASPTDTRRKYLVGKMNFNLVSTQVATDLDAEIKKVHETYINRGLEIGESVEADLDFDGMDNIFEFFNVEAVQALGKKNKTINYELWTSVMLYKEYYYFVTLLTPSREHDYYTWSRNTQTFKTFLTQMKPFS